MSCVGDWQLTEVLGSGAQGRVYKCQHVSTGATGAMKLVSKPAAGSTQEARLALEVDILTNLNSDSVVKCFDVMWDVNLGDGVCAAWC